MDDFAALATRDPRLGHMLARLGTPPVRRYPATFAGLARIIAGQRVSAKAAAAVYQRVEAAGVLEPALLLAHGIEAVAALGLGAAKARALHHVAEALVAGTLDFAHLETLEDGAVAESLLSFRGVGRWTVDVFLLFCLRRPDVFPAGDLALRLAWGRVADPAAAPPTERELLAIAQDWRPYRSAAAHLLWAAYATG